MDLRNRHDERAFWHKAAGAESIPRPIDPAAIDAMIEPRTLDRAIARVAAFAATMATFFRPFIGV